MLHATTHCYPEAMLKRDYEGQDCSIARALEIVGERWTLLIVRDALLGLHRFEEFQESLGIARNVLTARLNRLVDEGILERVRYSERPQRYEYHLIQKGYDLDVALAGLRQSQPLPHKRVKRYAQFTEPSRPALVGRERELTEILQLLDNAATGGGGLSSVARPGSASRACSRWPPNTPLRRERRSPRLAACNPKPTFRSLAYTSCDRSSLALINCPPRNGTLSRSPSESRKARPRRAWCCGVRDQGRACGGPRTRG